MKFFGRFNKETDAVQSLADLEGDILVRYIEWLNAQRTAPKRSIAAPCFVARARSQPFSAPISTPAPGNSS